MHTTRFLALFLVATPLAAQSHGSTSAASPAKHAVHWTYSGHEGPSEWAKLDPAWGVCTSGHEQSPIDLGGAVRSHSARIDEHFTPSSFVLFHNGHTVQAALERPSTLATEGSEFDAVQFHFHHPSEHTVQGKAYPGELHLVHRSAKGELAVLGIFLDVGPIDDPGFERLVARLPHAAGDSVKFSEPVDLASLLQDHSGEAEAIYTYHGSLTTPPCSEGVKWTVRSRPVRVSKRQMQELVKVLGDNARPVQAVGERHD